MATVKFGSIVTDLKGKLGGTVFQGSKVGGTAKNLNKKRAQASSNKLTKADAGRVTVPTRNISQLSSAWRSLSPAAQLSWTAAAPSFPFLNKYGEAYTPSGFQLYMSVNSNLLTIGESPMATAPIPSDLENCPEISVTAASGGDITIACAAGIPSGYVMQLSASVGMSAGRNVQKSDLKLIQILDDTTVFPLIVTTKYTQIFGSISAGGTIWVQGKLTKADAGRNSQPYTANTVTT